MCEAVTTHEEEKLECMLMDGHSGDHYSYYIKKVSSSESQHSYEVVMVHWNEPKLLRDYRGIAAPVSNWSDTTHLQPKGKKYVQPHQ